MNFDPTHTLISQAKCETTAFGKLGQFSKPDTNIVTADQIAVPELVPK